MPRTWVFSVVINLRLILKLFEMISKKKFKSNEVTQYQTYTLRSTYPQPLVPKNNSKITGPPELLATQSK